jgi:chemotaxis protein methyltransferase CheR
LTVPVQRKPVPWPEFALTDRDFNRIRALLARLSGISLAEHKRQLVHGRLSRRIRALGLSSFAQYCEMLSAPGGGEIPRLVNAMTTNVTAFFREPHHFEYIERTLVPEYLAADGRRLRIWSAGASSGEEPYSIAMTIADALGDERGVDWKILATDIDGDALAHARAGIYRLNETHAIAGRRRRRWLERGVGAHAGKARIVAALKTRVAFMPLNLMQPWPMHGPLDAIFCRNVIIYFDKATRQRLIGRFADLLRDGGYLFLGHSESLHGVSERFRLIGRTIYKKEA